ncbi:hypothetical protein C8Q72DRAFT_75772 [Fomitopsis betulina]|nr:hypothetical protein C8Q72DRAFT_75772 [Fomitopsis betulina]
MLCSLPNLQEVDIERVGVHTSKLINNLSSAPRKLVLRGEVPGQVHGALVLEPSFSLWSGTTLVVDNPGGLPPPKDLAQAFPNAVALDFTCAIQREAWTLLAVGIPVAASWPSVECVSGSVSSFEAWATTTPVHLVKLVDRLLYRDPTASSRLRPPSRVTKGNTIRSCLAANAVVANLQPTVLVVELVDYATWLS